MVLGTVFSLAICLFFLLFYLAKYLNLSFLVLANRGMARQIVSGSVLSGFLDPVIWGIAVFVVLAWIVYALKSNMVRGTKLLVVGSLVGLCGLAVWVCLVVVGFVGVWSLVLISGLLLGLCFVFAFGFFGVGRLGFVLRLLFGVLLLVLFVELASFVLFNVPVALGLDGWGFRFALGWG